MPERLRIALIAHDTKKDALVAWAKRWEHWLAGHTLLGTGSSAALRANDAETSSSRDFRLEGAEGSPR
jgi:methylglyoxal synthase